MNRIMDAVLAALSLIAGACLIYAVITIVTIATNPVEREVRAKWDPVAACHAMKGSVVYDENYPAMEAPRLRFRHCIVDRNDVGPK